MKQAKQALDVGIQLDREAGLAVRRLPWNDDFDQFLMKASESTYKYSGEELLHEIHKEAIEAKWINLRLHKLVRSRLAMVISLQALMIAILLWR